MHRDRQVAEGNPVAHLRHLRSEAPAAAVARRQSCCRLPGHVFHPGELPGAGEQRAVVRAAEEEHTGITLHHRHHHPPFLRLPLHPRLRIALRIPGGRGAAAGDDRAKQALRPSWHAQSGTELHQRLVAVARPRRIEKLFRGGEQPSPGGAPFRVSLQGEPAGEDPLDVAVEHRCHNAEGDARDRRRGVAADARQRQQAVEGARKAGTGRRDLLCRGMELPRPPVVAEAGPESEHVVQGRRGQRFHGRKAVQEALVIRQHHLDARLLQHHLGEPDAIGVALPPPGQVAAVPVKPVEKSLDVPHRVILSGRRPKWQTHLADLFGRSGARALRRSRPLERIQERRR